LPLPFLGVVYGLLNLLVLNIIFFSLLCSIITYYSLLVNTEYDSFRKKITTW
jgi:hypothetical protein